MPTYLRKVEEEKDVPENTIEELIEVNLDLEDSGKKKVLVRAQLTKAEREKVAECLRRNKDIFAWSHMDIPGVDPKEAKLFLNIDPSHLPVRQKQRRFAQNKTK